MLLRSRRVRSSGSDSRPFGIYPHLSPAIGTQQICFDLKPDGKSWRPMADAGFCRFLPSMLDRSYCEWISLTVFHGIKTLPRLVGAAVSERLRVLPAVVVTGARQTRKSGDSGSEPSARAPWIGSVEVRRLRLRCERCSGRHRVSRGEAREPSHSIGIYRPQAPVFVGRPDGKNDAMTHEITSIQ
jgi:hypothetical protein